MCAYFVLNSKLLVNSEKRFYCSLHKFTYKIDLPFMQNLSSKFYFNDTTFREIDTTFKFYAKMFYIVILSNLKNCKHWINASNFLKNLWIFGFVEENYQVIYFNIFECHSRAIIIWYYSIFWHIKVYNYYNMTLILIFCMYPW